MIEAIVEVAAARNDELGVAGKRASLWLSVDDLEALLQAAATPNAQSVARLRELFDRQVGGA